MISNITTIDCPTPGGLVPDDDIPAMFKVANRVPLTAEQEAKLAANAPKGAPSSAKEAAVDETKKAKARGRIATLKAKKAGETAKMPLQGKEALAAIGGGKKGDRLPIPPRAPRGQGTAPTQPKEPGPAKPAQKAPGAKKKPARAKKSAPKARGGAPRGPSKGDAVVAMLKARWTPMADILKETGWLAHTARAWLSRLRSVEKLNVEHKKTDDGPQYRITA